MKLSYGGFCRRRLPGVVCAPRWCRPVPAAPPRQLFLFLGLISHLANVAHHHVACTTALNNHKHATTKHAVDHDRLWLATMKAMSLATLLALAACTSHPESHALDFREVLPTLSALEPHLCSICISVDSGKHQIARNYHTCSVDGPCIAQRSALHAVWQVITASSESCWAAILQQFCCKTGPPSSIVRAWHSARASLIHACGR